MFIQSADNLKEMHNKSIIKLLKILLNAFLEVVWVILQLS